MFCRTCGTDIGNFRFCPNCGTDSQRTAPAAPAPVAAPAPSAADLTAKVKSTIADIASAGENIDELTGKVKSTFIDITGGDNSDVAFRLRNLFENVLQKHTTEESEALLISGTSAHTPDERHMADNWPRPWLYARVFAVLASTFALLLVCAYVFENTLSIPGLVVMGSMMMPFTLLMLFWETNIPRNISIFELVKMFFVGGVASLVFTLTLFSFVPVGELNVTGAILVGIVEEIGKLAAVVLFIRKSNTKYILNGLLIGAAIGAGFAGFESAGYALVYTDSLSGIVENILLRGVLAAGGHVVWAAMSGAAVMMAMDENHFTTEIFKRPQFLRLFLVPVVLHALWDMPFSSLPVLAGLTAVAWVFVLALIRTGMAEVTSISQAAKAAFAAAAAAAVPVAPVAPVVPVVEPAAPVTAPASPSAEPVAPVAEPVAPAVEPVESAAPVAPAEPVPAAEAAIPAAETAAPVAE